MENLDYLLQESDNAAQAVVDENSLDYILKIADERTKLLEEKEIVEARLKQLTTRITELEQKILPNAMYEKGLSSLEMTNGYKLRLKEQISCTVKNMSKLVEFLDERGDGSLISTTVTLGKVPKEISSMIAHDLRSKYNLDAVPEYKIHAMTLKAYFSRLCGINEIDPGSVAIAEIDPDMLAIHTYYKVVTSK